MIGLEHNPVLIVLIVSILNGIRVQVGALGDGLKQLLGLRNRVNGLVAACFWWGDEGELDCLEIVVAGTTIREIELEIDGGELLVLGTERLDGVDANQRVGDGDAGFGGRAVDGQGSK